ncbi:DUF397 domain-containing protein [Streptomyces sp. MBT65]|uniref:DUF397 domain-containing protein n=1 Tax=Streptomyces sp. MBT65 TaxID=1488395 RepID=UPI0027DA8205|nr:DUF397 domain-containing protein [Streptomyces sp. MBT65]
MTRCRALPSGTRVRQPGGRAATWAESRHGGGGVADRASAWRWQKSSYTSLTGECVEVACPGDEVWVRDSKNRRQRHMVVTSTAWSTFVTAVAAGRSGGDVTRPA